MFTKKYLLKNIISFFVYLFAFISFGQAQTIDKSLLEKIKEDDPVFKRQREEWIRSMHRTEPGINYELIDRATRESKQQMHMNKSLRDSTKPGGVEAHWIERGSNNLAGRMHTADIDFNRGLIYAGSAGGHVWRGTINGQNWTSLNDAMRIGDIRMVRILKKGNINRIVVVGNGPVGVFYSDDEGTSWQTAKGLEIPPRWGNMRRGIIAHDTTNSIYVLCIEWDWTKWRALTAIYRSTDLGENFSNIARYDVSSVSGDLFDIWTAKYFASPVYLVHRDTLSMITPEGNVQKLSQINIDRNFSEVGSTILQGFADNNGVEFLPLFQFNDGTADCYTSSDAGATWSLRGSVGFHMFNMNSYAVSTVNRNMMFTGGVNVYRSINGGVNWRVVNSWVEYYGDMLHKLHADIPEISFHRDLSNQENILISTDGGLYVAQDTMSAVTNLSLNKLNVSQYYSTYTNRQSTSIVYAGSQDQGFQRSMKDTSGAKDFVQLISGDYGHLTSTNDGKTLWCNYPGFTLLYPKSADPNPPSASWDFANKGRLWLPPIIADPMNPSIAYIAVGGADTTSRITRLIYDSLTNKIASVELTSFDFSLGNRDRKASCIGISEYDNSKMYVTTSDGKFFFSGNGGWTWDETIGFAGPGSHYFYGSSMLVSKSHSGKIIIGGSGYSNPGAYASFDHGKTFTAIDRGLPKTLIYDLAWTPDESLIFAATEVGPYMYVAADSMWYDIGGKQAPQQVYWCVEYISSLNTARFGTYGRGIWDYKIDKITSVKRTHESSPISSLLLNAYPNPVQDKTILSFQLNEETTATLRIYDMLGRVVSQPVNGTMQEGVHQFIWNRRTDSGYKLPVGTYVAILAVKGMTTYKILTVVD